MSEKEKIDAALSDLGYDPEEVSVHGEVLVKALLDNQRLRARLAKAERLAVECDLLKLKTHFCPDLNLREHCIVCEILKMVAEFRKEG